MSTGVILLITFFTLYDGIRSKFTQQHIVKMGRWIDYHSIKFIRGFRDKSNTELFDRFHQHSITLLRAFFACAIILPFLGLKPLYTAFGFVGALLLLIASSTKKRYIKDIKKSLNHYSFMALITAMALAIFWIHDFFTGKQLLQDFLRLAYEPINIMIQQSGLNQTMFWSVLAAILIIGVGSNIIFWLLLHGMMWGTVSFCRLYAKMCLWLNQTQPLKPAYIVTKSIIIIIVHLISTK